MWLHAGPMYYVFSLATYIHITSSSRGRHRSTGYARQANMSTDLLIITGTYWRLCSCINMSEDKERCVPVVDVENKHSQSNMLQANSTKRPAQKKGTVPQNPRRRRQCRHHHGTDSNTDIANSGVADPDAIIITVDNGEVISEEDNMPIEISQMETENRLVTSPPTRCSTRPGSMKSTLQSRSQSRISLSSAKRVSNNSL